MSADSVFMTCGTNYMHAGNLTQCNYPCRYARVDGKPTNVWEGIDIKPSNCPTKFDKTTDSTTVITPKYNFSENGKKLDTKMDAGEESTWLDENREVGE